MAWGQPRPPYWERSFFSSSCVWERANTAWNSNEEIPHQQAHGQGSNMKRFYLTGQRTFGNRGCEAIVRSTVGLLKARFGQVEVMVPSADIRLDSAQWPEAADSGVKFVEAYTPRHAG